MGLSKEREEARIVESQIWASITDKVRFFWTEIADMFSAQSAVRYNFERV